MTEIDMLHYDLRMLEQWVPQYTEYLHSFKHTNKFFESFIQYKVNKIAAKCNDLLIDDSGRCNWTVIEELQERGFDVGPGEQDRFGWLTGIVNTAKGTIVYG